MSEASLKKVLNALSILSDDQKGFQVTQHSQHQQIELLIKSINSQTQFITERENKTQKFVEEQFANMNMRLLALEKQSTDTQIVSAKRTSVSISNICDKSQPLTPLLRESFGNIKYLQDLNPSAADYGQRITQLWNKAFEGLDNHPSVRSTKSLSVDEALKSKEQMVHAFDA